MKNVAVCRILLLWQWHGRCLSLAPSHSLQLYSFSALETFGC